MASKNEEIFQVRADNIKARRVLYVFGITFILCVGAYSGVLILQSSMNVEEGLGTKSVMITFITSSISSLVLVPYMIDFLGAKAAIIIGEIGFLVYIAANFYPSWYTLIPASIFHGLTESAPWAGSSVYVTFLGERQWLHRQNRSNVLKSKEFYIYKFFCQFAGVIIFADMFGSGIVSLFLLAFQNIDTQTNTRRNHTISSIDSLNDYTTTNGYIMTASSETTNHIKIVECGSNDCPVRFFVTILLVALGKILKQICKTIQLNYIEYCGSCQIWQMDKHQMCYMMR